MASEKGDPRALKRQVVHLLLQYPRGIRFEDFAGTFHQLHGYHPRISLHGYRSLKKLLADMENVVVVEGNSLSPIMKIADGFCLDHWLEGDEENDLEISEGETENLTDEADIGGETALSEVLDLLVSLLEKHKMGLRIKRVQKIMLSRHGINMKKLSVSLGYRNILEFLKHQMPELKIQYGQTTGKCVVQVPEGFSLPSPCARIPKHVKERTHQAPDLSAVFVLIQDVLKGFRDGIKVKKLTKLLRKNHGFDLQTFCSRLGYKDVLSCLQDIHGLFLQNISKTRNCVVHLQACPFSSALSLDSDFSACSSPSAPQGLTRINSGTSSPTPSLDPGFSAGNTDAVPEKLTTKTSDLAATLVPILGVLGVHPHGMTLDALTKSLKSKHGFDLEAFCQSMGYEDVMSCLLHVPGLRLSFTNGRCPASCVVQLLSGSLDLPHSSCGATSDLDKPLPSSGSNVLSQESMKAKPASCSSAPSQSSVSLSLDLKKCTDKQKAASCSSVASESSTSFSLGMHEVANKPNNLEQNVVGRHPALVKVLNLLVNLLRQYKMGLRINRVQKFMLSKHGVNMKKFSVAQGYKDILEFLEHQMPGLNIQYQENTGKCVVQAREGVCLLSPYARTPDHMKEEALSAAVVLIQDVLKGFRDGIKVKKLKKFLRKNRGFDLDVFYSRMGYKDVLSCLQDIPGLFLQNINETQNCVVHLQSYAVPEKLMTKRSGPSAACVPPLSFGSVPPLQPTKMLEPASCSSTPSQSNVSLSLDLEKCTDKQKAASFSSAAPQSNTSFSLDIQEVANRLNNLEQNVVGRHPGPSAACVSPLSFGSVPPLQPTKMLEPVNTASAFGDISKPSVRAHDISASKSQSQSLSFPASSMSTAVKNGIHPSIHVPFPVVPNHPSIQEACSSSSAKANNSCQSVSSGPLQKPSAHQFGGPSPVEEVSFQLDRQLPSKSNMTKGESSKGQDDLKQQVAHILAMHPEGMSLFQFRVAYSATYQRHLPLGNAASAKRCLMEMPDVVYMKNYGVQTLLLPVTCAMSSVKSGQPVSSIEEKAPVVLGHSLPRTVPVTEPNSEDLGGKHSKAGCPFPEPQLHKAPKPVAPVQEHVKMSPKPVGGHFIPQSPVVFPTYPEARTSGENLKPDSHLTNPWISGNSASVPSASQPASDNFGTRAQPVAYPSVPVLFQMPGIPPVQPVSFLPVSRNPSGIHFQKTAPQSSPSAQPPHVLPIRYAQTAPLIHHTQQQSCIHAFPQVDPYSAVQKSSRNLQHAQSPAFSSPPGSPPVFSPSRNMSQSVHQLEYYNHMQQDGLQHSSVVVAEKSLIVTPLDRKPMPPSSAYLRQYGDGNSLATSASTVSFGSHSFLSSSASLYPLDNSSSSIRSSNALPSQPPAFVYQQQSTSISTTTVRTSGIRPACSPSSLLDSTAVPYYNPLCPSGINNNSATQSSEPRASIHRLQYTSMSTSETTYPQGSTLRSSCQLSNSSSSVRTDYKAPAQANPMASVSKQAGSFHVSLPEKQMSNYSLPQNSPPPKSSDKCVIL